MTLILIAFRNLFLAKRRTFLLGTAIASVSLFFVVLLSAGRSVSDKLLQSATTLSAGHINISGFFKRNSISASPIIENRTEMLKFAKDLFPEAISIIDRHRGWGRIISSESSFNAGLTGINYDQEQQLFKTLILAKKNPNGPRTDENLFGSFDSMKRENSALIFEAQAKKLGVTVGDSVTVVIEGNDTGTNSIDLTIGAIVENVGFMSNFQIFVTKDAILKLYRLSPETTGAIQVYFSSPDFAETALSRARTALLEKKFQVLDYDPNPFFFKFDRIINDDWIGQKYDLTIWKDEVSYVLWISQAFSAVTGFIMLVLSIVIIGGIGNTMWMAVRERTKEIGTMRAIGAQKEFVTMIFMSEAIILGIIFSLVGGLLGLIILRIVTLLHIPISQNGIRTFLMAQEYQFPVSFVFVAISVSLFAMVNGIAALLPSLRAGRMDPVEALMHGK